MKQNDPKMLRWIVKSIKNYTEGEIDIPLMIKQELANKKNGMSEDSLNEHGDPWEDPDYDPRGGGDTRSPEQIAKDNAENARLSKKLGLKNTNKLPDIKDDMLKMMNHFWYDEPKKKKK
jgi:hypothetical protein